MQPAIPTIRPARPRRSAFSAAVVALVLTIAACDGDGITPPGNQPGPSIGVSLSASTLEVTQGETGTVTVSVTRAGGYAGAVDLSLEGAPNGVTGTFAPASVGSGTATSTLTIAAAPSEEFGTYQVTVRAAGQAVEARTATFSLTVNQAPQQPQFTVSLEPDDVSIAQGATGKVIARVTRHGAFDGPVSFTVTDHPLQLGVGAPTIASDTGSIQLATSTAGGTLAPGSYTVTLRAGSAGIAYEQTLTLTVRVTAPQTGESVTWSFCADDPMPVWIGYQSGDGAWSRATPNGRDVTFSVAGRGAIAWVQPGPTGGSYETQVVYASAAELASFGGLGCAFAGAEGSKRLTGTVAGMTAGSFAQVQIGNRWVRTQPVSPSFTLSGLAEGPLDLIATRASAAFGNGDDAWLVVDRFIIRRGLNLPNNSAIPTLDFGSAEAFAPATHTITMGGLGADQAMVTLGYLTGGGNASLLSAFFGGYYMGLPSASESQQLPFVPADRQAAGDLHAMTIMARRWDDESSDATRTFTSFFHLGMDRSSVVLGPALGTPAVTAVGGGAAVRLRAELPRQAEYGNLAWVSFSQDDRDVSITATAGYLNGASAWDLAVPDLTIVHGFDAAWSLRKGAETGWSASAFGTNGTLIQFFQPVDGAVFRSAQRSGSIVP